MRISVVGTGYVGLITGVGLAVHGHKVVCVDINDQIVQRLNEGKATIYEKGLDAALAKVCQSNCFKATVNLKEAICHSELTIVAVGTPNFQGQIDLKYIQQAIMEIGALLRHKDAHHTVIVKSTVLPGTTDSFVLPILERCSGKRLGEFGLGFNPEFLKEGTAMEDFMNPDRIVLGADGPQSAKDMRRLYAEWDAEIVEVNTRTAEMIKYANNCLLATQISAVNELANIAAELGNIDIYKVMKGVHLDKRWTPMSKDGTRIQPGIVDYLWPGCGFGGSCFPKDVNAMLTLGKEMGLPMLMLKAVLETNSHQPLQIVNLLAKSLGELRDKKIAVLGLAFKPNTDDIRQSPAFAVIRNLVEKGSVVSAADPIACDNAKLELDGMPVALYADWRRAVKDVDAVAFITGWDEYKAIESSELKNLMNGNVIVDARGICQHLESSNLFEIYKIGYSPISQEIVETTVQ